MPFTEYRTPEDDLADIIVDLALANSGTVKVGGMSDTFTENTQVVVRMLPGSLPNPKWQYDELSFVIMVVGANRAAEGDVKNQIWNMQQALLGSNNILKGDNLYLHFSVSSLPNNQGYLDNTKPLYSFNIDVNLQKQTDTGHRQAI